ncbi:MULTISPECIES: ferredoxin Fer [Halorubrum]|uniref:Ferredoxin n=1 Tax=Halorubrum sodomense TaxID=35743 RepID=A0A1I6FMQ5_HALSD|nr:MULTISPECIES: ferredoxin Fer [Halorubrum]TKX55450.1 2Fe-2S iron-sulfur cluster binding domain-containing protein [Halorubrum sp. SP3]TKX70655.1 2Fe-2S iron-sulfur cluster binding domain-containing protein [Halorubrum sp. SP9]SFR31097.1 Ferredoxin [Halorubrum sodomense]
MVSPFEVLEVDEDADDEAVERAYRERVKRAHPDQGGSIEEFQLVRRAYRELSERDRNGDESGEENGAGPADIDLSDDGDAAGPKPTRVEFLDYEAVVDYGWSLDDDELFRKAGQADLDPDAHGRLLVQPDESLLEAAERSGFAWPFSCRGGACANCAVYLAAGELSQPTDHIMPDDLAERGFRLSCNGYPLTDELSVVFNVKQRPELDDLILPPGPFTRR